MVDRAAATITRQAQQIRWLVEFVKDPPHPVEYVPDDSDRGRECMTCGVPVPGGYKHQHGCFHDRMRARDAQIKKATEGA